MTWRLADSLSLMAIGLLLDLFSSDFAIVSMPSEQSIAIDCHTIRPIDFPHLSMAIDCKRHPTNRFSTPIIAIDCPGFTPLGWGVSRLRRLFIIFNDRHIINQKLTDFLFFRKLKHIFSYIYVIKSFC